MKGLLSVIVPVYNVDKYLSECIESILYQNYTNIEILLIDDGSTDNSLLICQEYCDRDNRITVFHKENEGVSSARNLGLKNAKGDFVAFVDGDDWVEPDYFSNGINKMICENTQVCAFTTVIYSKKIGKLYDLRGIIKDKKCLFELNRYNFPTSVWCCIYRTMALSFAFDEEIHFYEDLMYMYMLLNNVDSVSVSNYPGYHYRLRDNSANTSPFNNKLLSSMLIPEKLEITKQFSTNQIRIIDQRICLGIAMNMQKKEYFNKELSYYLTQHSRYNFFSVFISPFPLNKKMMTGALAVSETLFRKIYSRVSKGR